MGVARELPQLRGRGVRGALEGHGREGGAACQWEGVGGRGVGERGVGGRGEDLGRGREGRRRGVGGALELRKGSTGKGDAAQECGRCM